MKKTYYGQVAGIIVIQTFAITAGLLHNPYVSFIVSIGNIAVAFFFKNIELDN